MYSDIIFTTLMMLASLLTSTASSHPIINAPHSTLEPRDQSSTPGIYLTNHGWTGRQTFNFYPNVDGYGAVGGGMVANPSVAVDQGATVFVPLPIEFEGRVQRGAAQVATWVEFRLTDPYGIAWGDVSLEAGCNGPATISGDGATTGFTERLVLMAQKQMTKEDFDQATVVNADGELALKATGDEGELDGIVAAFEERALGGLSRAYISGGSGVVLARSTNHHLAVVFY